MITSFVSFSFEQNMDISILFDLVPIALAFVAILALRDCANTTEIKLSRAAAIILIICQSTWMHSYMNDFPVVLSVIDKLWTVFNSLAMILILVIASQYKK